MNLTRQVGGIRILVWALAAAAIAALAWYVFVDTLAMSELIDDPTNPTLSIIVNFLDFDTGLTRFDVMRMERRSDYWERRTREVLDIRNPKARDAAQQELLAEMLRDPGMKKLAMRLRGIGSQGAMTVLDAIF